ncbi:MAG: hypothetical protein HN742_28155 [Lentisphaerae bacterium]|nr:hypothetical protein [Lentisphaerota bacterium]MBT5606097.1 hypothetical protein [Lentisphaerota bacterium]MBT7058545.1 hypothetical protein [Lentisphaerota bacterium]MBT7845779.1 hypothetical protein [Lentisphaerota bacterium]
MSDELNLTLPQRPGKTKGGRSTYPWVTPLILIAVVANLVVAFRAGGPSERSGPRPGQLDPDAQRKLALKLEKQGLTQPAVDAWLAYLDVADADDEKRARVWYRIGQAYEEGRQYAEALAAYYRSESFAELTELSSEISRRTQTCLEALGKFAVLRHELADRVGLKQDGEKGAGEKVVAEIGAHKITEAELDRKIEAQIETQLAQYASFMSEDQRRQQKEEMLKRLSVPQQKIQMLSQMVMEEVLYRRAREIGLDQEPDVRALLDETERGLLAQRLIQREMSEKIRITSSDVELYYQANKATFVAPERVKISHILVPDAEKANAVLESLEKGEDFAALAKGVSTDSETADKGGEIAGWVAKGAASIPSIGEAPKAVGALFTVEPGAVLPQPVTTDKGCHVIKLITREDERQKAFEDVQQEAYKALRQQKEREVQGALMEGLRKDYDVVLHQSRFAPTPAAETDPSGGNTARQK